MYLRNILDYELNDLEPFVDTATMEEHFNKHFLKYNENLNKALMEWNIPTDGSFESLVKVLREHEFITELRNNGGGYINHFIYFENMSPRNNDYESFASEELKSEIDKYFGGYEGFKYKFKKAGMSLFGSGWVWLAFYNGRLVILTTKNQDNPLMETDMKLLLGMDMWEHAYYLKHKSNKEKYIDDFFKVIDWEIVSNRL